LPPTCGPPSPPAPLSLTGERRFATVLIADVKSSTLLAEKIGTEAWVEVMNKVLQVCAAEIQRFGGEVDQFRGDGLIAFFGARAAHEDDPERAVLAAMTMQNAVHRLAHELGETLGIHLLLRVGVNTGEVIAANIGNGSPHSEDTAMGGAVALAARMESAAEPGTVLVSENTYRLTALQFKWEPLGEISVTGVSHPVAVYRPLAPLSEAEQHHRLQEYGLSIPLIGRDQEFSAIQKAILQLRDGVGGIVMVNGAAGLGKSRLIAEVEQSVQREEALAADAGTPITWLRGRARSYDQSLPHSMWIDVLRGWLGLREWESKEQELARLQHKCQELWGDEYEGYYPYLAKFLSLPLDKSFSSWIEHLEAEGLHQQFFLAVKSWVEAVAKRGPVVIIFAEAHWADDASLEMLKHCLPLSDTEQVLWMVIFRPDPSAPTWAFNHYVETEFPHRITAVELSGLSESDSCELLGRLIGAEVLPDEMPILVKLNTNDYMPKPGVDPNLTAKNVRWLANLGVDGVELSCGTSYSFHSIRGRIPINEFAGMMPWWMRPLVKFQLKRMVSNCAYQEAYNLDAAKVIGAERGDLRLFLVGGMRGVAHMEEVLEQGYADYISMSRPFIREPFLVKRFKEGKQNEVACISCNNCMVGLMKGLPLRCYVDGLPG